MQTENYWRQFECTGKIEDYLSYRSCANGAYMGEMRTDAAYMGGTRADAAYTGGTRTDGAYMGGVRANGIYRNEAYKEDYSRRPTGLAGCKSDYRERLSNAGNHRSNGDDLKTSTIG